MRLCTECTSLSLSLSPSPSFFLSLTPYLHLHDINLFILLLERESEAVLHVDLSLLVQLLDLFHLRELALELLLRVGKSGLQRIVLFLEITVSFHELMGEGGERERESYFAVRQPLQCTMP